MRTRICCCQTYLMVLMVVACVVASSSQVDVLVMGSMQLSNATAGHFLGSVARAVTKGTQAHCLVVKNFVTT